MTSKVDSEAPSLWRIRDLIENPQAVMHALHSIGLPPDRAEGGQAQREPISAAARAVETSSQFIAGKVEMISEAARALLALDSLSPGDDTSDGSAVADIAASVKNGTKGDAANDSDDDDEGNIHAFWVPGRVELAGKHTDYAGGRSLLVAIPKGFVAIARARLARADTDADIDAEGRGESAHFDESASRKRRKTTGDRHVDSSDECARAADVSNWCRVVTLDPSVSAGDRVVHVRLDGGDTDGHGEEEMEEGHWSHYVRVAIRRISRNYREIASAATKAMTSSSISSSSSGASSSRNVMNSTPLPRLRGIDLVIGCDIPIAAGMSTSSALICSVFMALDAVNDHKIREALRLALYLPRREVNREEKGEREAATVAPAVKDSTGCDQEYRAPHRQDGKGSGEGEKGEEEDWEEEFDGEEDGNGALGGTRGGPRAGGGTASTTNTNTTTDDHVEGSPTRRSRDASSSSDAPSPSVEDCALCEYLGCVENGKPYDTAMGAAAAPTTAEVEEASKFIDFREIIDKMSSEALHSYDFDGWEPLQRRRRRRERQWLESGRGLVLSGDGGVGTFGGSEDHTAIMACRAGRASIFRFCPTFYESSFAFPSHRFSLVVASSGVSAQKSKGETKANYNGASEAAKAAAEALNCATLGECFALGMATSDKEGQSKKRSNHTKSGSSSSSSNRRGKNADVGVPCLLGGLMACMDRLDWDGGKKNCIPKEEKVGVFNLINCYSSAELRHPRNSGEQVDATSQTGASAPSSIHSLERNDVAMAHLRRLVQFTFESEVVVPKLALAIERCDRWGVARYSGTSQSCSDEILGNIIDETRWLPESALGIGEEMYFTSGAGSSSSSGSSSSWPRRWIDEDSPFVVKERPFINVCCGASAFGAGFGGSVWALVDSNVAHEFAARWRQAYLATFDPEVADANGDSEQMQDRRYTESSSGSSTNTPTKTGTDSNSGTSLESSCNFFVVPTASPGACTIVKVR